MDDIWTCPACERRFAKPNTRHVCERHAVEDHLATASPNALTLYHGLKALAAECGEFFEEATKTAISFKTPQIFMAVAFKKSGLNCTIWLPEPLRHRRIRHSCPVPGGLYAIHFQITDEEELDPELKNWLCRAYFYLVS
jgi:hypothetical protein